MPKEESITAEGEVVEVLPNTQFRVELAGGQVVLAYTGGRMKRNKIKVMLGDKVTMEISPYDLTKGRIIRRL